MDLRSAIGSLPVPPTFTARSSAIYLVMLNSYHAAAGANAFTQHEVSVGLRPLTDVFPSAGPWGAGRREKEGALLRRALGQDALQRAAVHVETPRGLRDVAVAQLVDALDVLPAHAIGRHGIFGRRGFLV